MLMSKPFRLRPYQKKAVAAVVSRYLEKRQRRMLLYLPTGAGKTVIATHIIKALRTTKGFGKVLFVAHRREIIDQTARTIRRHLPGLKVQIEQGKRTTMGRERHYPGIGPVPGAAQGKLRSQGLRPDHLR
jgi:ATP-dependent helicase IRC3